MQKTAVLILPGKKEDIRPIPNPPETGVAIFFPATEAFPGSHSPFEILNNALVHLDQWNTLHFLSRLTWILQTQWQSDFDSIQKGLIRELLPSGVLSRFAAFLSRYRGAHVMVFFRQQVLEAMRWILLRGQRVDGQTLPLQADTLRQMVALLLAAGEIWGNRQGTLLLQTMASSKSIEELRSYSGLFTRTGVWSGTPSRNPILPIARSAHLFGDIMGRHLPTFGASFEQATGMKYEDFHVAQSMVWASILQRPSRDPLVTIDSSDQGALTEKVEAFLGLESQPLHSLRATFDATAQDPSHEWSLLSLRRRPALQVPGLPHSFLVVDPLLFAESITNGPLFMSADSAVRQATLDAFGKAFEDYVSEILSNVYPEHPLGLRCRRNVAVHSADREIGEIDAYVNYGFAVLIFEAKASFLSELPMVRGDAAAFTAELEGKYVESPTGNPKGVSQLASTVKILSSRSWLGSNDELNAVHAVFPVLVVNDEYLEDPLATHYLAKRFQQKVGVEGEAVKGYITCGKLAVASLSVLTIDMLEILESSSENFSLLDLLSDFTSRFPDKLVSLNNFVFNSKYSRELLSNPRLTRMLKGKVDIFRSAAERAGAPSLSGRLTSSVWRSIKAKMSVLGKKLLRTRRGGQAEG